MIALTEISRPRQQRRRSILGSSSVRLVYGIHDLQVGITGVKVAEAQLAYKEILSVPDDAEAYIDGQRADLFDILQDDDRLEFVKKWGRKGSGDELKRIAAALERIANHFDPQTRTTVGTAYVAERLGITIKWVGDLVRKGEIPKSCICPKSGDGRYWRFWKNKIDDWIEER